MATLTETAYYARKTIRYSIIALILLIFLKISLSTFISYWKRTHPPPPPPPNVLFGKIPLIEFPKNEATISSLIYELETVTGDFPKMPTQAKVYFLPPIAPNLMGYDAAKERAKKMGFESEPEKLNERTFKWIDPKYPARKLMIDIVNGNFRIEYDYTTDQSILTEKDLPGKERGVQEARSFLSRFELLKPDLDEGKTIISYLKVESNTLVEVSSLLEANFIKIIILREEIDGLPVYYSDINKGPIVMILSGARDEKKRLVSLEYNYQLVDYENFATYPIISPEKAFEELKAGRGYVVSYEGGKNKAVIREVILGYFDSERPQTYLQPIYIFLGDDSFIGYVQAVKEEWIKK